MQGERELQLAVPRLLVESTIVVAHVRIRGGPGRQLPGLPDRLQKCSQVWSFSIVDGSWQPWGATAEPLGKALRDEHHDVGRLQQRRLRRASPVWAAVHGAVRLLRQHGLWRRRRVGGRRRRVGGRRRRRRRPHVANDREREVAATIAGSRPASGDSRRRRRSRTAALRRFRSRTSVGRAARSASTRDARRGAVVSGLVDATADSGARLTPTFSALFPGHQACQHPEVPTSPRRQSPRPRLALAPSRRRRGGCGATSAARTLRP